jgi:hypothetical protein
MKLLRLFALLLFAVPVLAAPGPQFYASAFAHPRLPDSETPSIRIVPAGAGMPANTFNVSLSWTASTSAAGCTSTATPACSNFGYNVLVGTTSGGESVTPANSSLITGTTYSYPVTLTGSAQTFYFVVQASETVVGLGTLTSANSNEASASFPGTPAAPTALVAVP